MPRIEICSSRILALGLLVIAIGLLGLTSRSPASRYFKARAASSAQSLITRLPKPLAPLFKEEKPNSSLSSRSIWNPSAHTELQAQSCSGPSFTAAQQFVVGVFPSGVAVGDFNGDHHSDLVAASLDGVVAVLMGNGSGNFSTATNLTLDNSANAVAVGDFNGDGKADLAVTSSDFSTPVSSAVVVMLGNGSGGFSAPTSFALGAFPASLAISDFNRDGKADLAVGGYQDVDGSGINGISMLLGDGQGGFGAPAHFPTENIPGAMAVGDFNGDGKADLAVTNIFSPNISILRGDGAGGLVAATSLEVTHQPKSVAVGDFNSDGQLDLAAAVYEFVAVWLNDGSGSFGAVNYFSAGGETNTVAVGDFNGDSKPDLAATISPLNFTPPNSVAVFSGDGSGGFGAAVEVAAGRNPAPIVVSDFNGDGKADLAVGNILLEPGTVSILLSNATGSLTSAPSYAGRGDVAVLVGDLDRDSNLDLVSVSRMSGENVSILRGDGAGGFGAASKFTMPGIPGAAILDDFNRDGKLDLVTAYRQDTNSSHPIYIALGNGSGSFGAVTEVRVANGPSSLAAGDFNGDGNLDLAVGNAPFGLDALSPTPEVPSIAILLGNGGGGFSPPTYITLGESPRSIAIGDFNGDAKLDLAVVITRRWNFGLGTNYISVLLGNGAGGFSLANNYMAGLAPQAITMGDFNQDGKLDLAVTDTTVLDSSDHFVNVLLGNGAGGFNAPVSYLVGANPLSILAGDFNGDNKLDLATANGDQNSVSVLQGDGAGNFHTASHFIGGEQLTSVAAGDFNRDGRLDLVTGSSLVGTSILLNRCGAAPTCAPPSLGNYLTAEAYIHNSAVVIPNAPPVDHGSIQTITATAPGFAGDLTVNPVTGAVTISQARPLGSYVVTVTVTNGCGATTTRTFPLNVIKANTGVEITTHTPNPSAAGQAVTVGFNVLPPGSISGTQTGNVTVSDGLSSCTGTVAAGNCTLVLTRAGTRTLVATYAGDQNFNGNTSSGVTHQVNRVPTTVTLTSSPNPSTENEAITFTATVTPPTATGTISFIFWSSFLGSATLNNGQAQFVVPTLAVGATPIVADYSGDLNHISSSSATLTQTVNPPPDYTIFTVAGNGNYGLPNTIGPATESAFKDITAIAKLPNGDLLIVDVINRTVRRVNAQGLISPFAGNGTSGNGGDGGLAIHASFGRIGGVAADAAGNVYLTDTDFNRIRIVTPDGKIAHFAGDKNGASGSGGEGVNAAQARLRKPTRMATDQRNKLYVADSGNHLVREINLATKIMTTIAGNGVGFYNGDNLPATAASLNNPAGIAVDAPGNVYIADTFNQRIRKVAVGSGIITTIAGNGLAGFNGAVVIPATSAILNNPLGVAVDAIGDIYIADQFNHRLCLISAETNIFSTITGNGEFAFFGDNGPAALAQIAYPSDVCLIKDTGRALFLADSGNRRVRKLDRDVEPNHAPVARANLLPTIITASDNNGATVDLDGSASTDDDGDVLSFIWMDGGTVIATTAIARVKLKVGTHSIVLKVLDERGGENLSAPQTVTVLPASSVTIDQISPSFGNRGSQVQMTVIGSGFTPQSKVTMSGFGLTIFTTYVSSNKLTVKVTISPNTIDVIRNLTVSNPDGSSATKVNGFTIR